MASPEGTEVAGGSELLVPGWTGGLVTVGDALGSVAGVVGPGFGCSAPLAGVSEAGAEGDPEAGAEDLILSGSFGRDPSRARSC